MKETFPGYYRPSTKELSLIWDNCLFVFDANVLLNLYRYTPETSTELLSILNKISKRIWVPHQAALEYQRNRLSVISQQMDAYDDITETFKKSRNQIESKLNNYLRHPYVDIRTILQDLDAIFEKISQRLNERKQEHPNLIDDDKIRDTITKIFKGNVGNPYTLEKKREICKEGQDRYKQRVPPGFSDENNKTGDDIYGDLILWFQVIDKAKEIAKPIVLITDDVKEDWWWRFHGKTIAPRPELVDEILRKANVSFFMYKSDEFMEYAREYLEQIVDQQAIDEVRFVREQYEQMRKLGEILRREQQVIMQRINMVEKERFVLKNKIRDLQHDIETKALDIDKNEVSNLGKSEDEVSNLQMYWENLVQQEEYFKSQYEKLSMEYDSLMMQQEKINRKLGQIRPET